MVAALLLTIGMLAPYPEIWRRGGRVVGISEYPVGRIPRPSIGAYVGPLDFLFLSMDSLGAAFSLFALGIASLGRCEKDRLNVKCSCSRTFRRPWRNNVHQRVSSLVTPAGGNEHPDPA